MNISAEKITCRPWGEYAGRQVYLFKIENAHGACVELTNYGATLVSAIVPDAEGSYGNVVLGFSSLQAYIDDSCYIGSTIGRYANRIAGAKFVMDGITYFLENNDGRHTNHGGNSGFNTRVFDHEIVDDSISFTLRSKDGDGGYPGDLDLTVNYQFTDLNELIITYQATSNKKTVANFTNHAYFNLSNTGGKIFEHALTVYAGQVLESDADYIPTGLIKTAGDRALTGTPLRSKMIIKDNEISGLNDCYALGRQGNTPGKPAAILFEKGSGRKLEVFTSYPALMVYTADHLESKHPGHHYRQYGSFDGICLECQYYPDSPNHPQFPTAVLEAGATYRETIVYKFSTSPL